MMKSFKQNRMTWAVRLGTVAVVGIFLAWTSVATADIQTWNCQNDGDGAINCLQTGWTEVGEHAYDLTIAGEQSWGPGHMVMDFTTDTPLDPTIKSINEVTNDTGVAWTGYVVNVTLDAATALTSYSISSPAVSLPIGWTVTNTPVLTSAGIVSGQYEYTGSIVLAGGTPVADGDELDFSYKLSFAGSTSYHAIQEQTPVPSTPVPEPGTLILVLGGLLGLAAARVARRR
jgi:hypothetical protein